LLSGESALPVLTTTSFAPSCASQAQPLPNCVVAAVSSSLRQASTLPNEASIFWRSAPPGSPPPWPLRLRQ